MHGSIRRRNSQHRLPAVASNERTLQIGSLLELEHQVDAFVFDAFGVLNVGETLIPGADRRLDELRALGCAIRILTNAASYDRSRTIAKFKGLGLTEKDEEIIPSREATLRHLPEGRLGVIAADADAMAELPADALRLGDDPDAYDSVDAFLFLSTADWTAERQTLLDGAMSRRPRSLLIGNADLAAPRDVGFSVEPGHFGHLIADRYPGCVRFFGKPFPEVYDLIEATLPGVLPKKIAMCGDTLHTDILGAAARGWRSVLVTKDGLFAGHDAKAYADKAALYADWCLERI